MLAKMFDPKSLEVYRDLGGLQGLAKGLRTDCRSGLSRDETTLDRVADRGRPVLFPSSPEANPQPYAERKRVFGENRLPERDVKSILQLMWLTFNDKVLMLLAAVATISLGLGLYQTFGQPHRPGQPRVEWVEGVTIMTAVIIVVVVGSLNDYQKEKQFAKLNRKVSYCGRGHIRIIANR
jgi:P-type Ca2+ transporter type 2C